MMYISNQLQSVSEFGATGKLVEGFDSSFLLLVISY